MNPKFRQLPPAIIGAAMMTLLAERAGLLWGGAAVGLAAAAETEDSWSLGRANENSLNLYCIPH